MSVTINPPALIFGGMQPGEQRLKSAKFVALLADADTALTTPTATIARQDGTTMGPSDLQIIGTVTLDSTNTIVTAELGNGTLAPVSYAITFGAKGNVSGLAYSRTVYISVVPALG